MSQFFASGDQSIGVSATASDLPMISFRMDWLDLLAVQGTLKSLLQHHSSWYLAMPVLYAFLRFARASAECSQSELQAD